MKIKRVARCDLHIRPRKPLRELTGGKPVGTIESGSMLVDDTGDDSKSKAVKAAYLLTMAIMTLTFCP